MWGSWSMRRALRIIRRVGGRAVAWVTQTKLQQQSSGPGLGVARSSGSDIFVFRDGTEIPKINGPIFTVVIPTMDRVETVADTIRTCLAQEDENFRIIISDNASIDNTAEVVRSFSDSRLSYVNPGRRLGMAEHWEFALAHVEDGFVTVLGDDDGLLPGAVSFARQIVDRHNAKAFSWRKVEYCWPDHIVPSFRNWLQVPLATNIRKMNSLDVVKGVVSFRENYGRLPCIYNAFISTAVIRSYQSKNGGIFFGGSIPDIYSGFAIASELEELIFCERPLSINGASGKSNGTRHTVGNKDDALAKSFWTDTKYAYEPGIPQGSIVEFCLADSFLKVQKVVERFSPVMIDKKHLIESAASGTFGGYIPASRYDDRLQALKEYAQTHGLLDLFEKTCERYHRTDAEPRLPTPGYYEPDAVVFDASILGVENVYSASLRVAEILDLKAEQQERFQRLLASRRPDLAIARFIRSNCSSLRFTQGRGAA